MINVQFFPSRRIAFYMARLFLVRTLAVLAALVLILMTLDLLGESGKILAPPQNGDAELWRYVSLRIPMLIARFLPFSVLLGTLITLATLNQHSEVIAMKAAGISAHQIIAPLVVASFAVAALSFVFNERLVTRATATLAAWEAVDYGRVPGESGVSSNVWVRHGEDLIHARQVSGRGEGVVLGGLTIYARSAGTLARILDAESARRGPGGWRLANVRIFDVAAVATAQTPSLVYGPGLEPAQFTLARVDPDEQSFGRLRQSIADLRLAGRPTATLEANLWHKISGPASAVLMPLLAGVAAFGLARSGQLLLRAVMGMGLGFAYFVADNFAIAMGNYGAYPPLLAAWGPFALFLMIGETVLIRTEE
ncbi:MAG: lipopolysaccharide export system permease protein [Sphingomonadales bacterium]|jgi:lipopolysaccharide export system permease protein|nr:lipopolysaccharide export system permease protein [Sphingomonadales bacterium]